MPNNKVSTQKHNYGSQHGNPRYPIVRYIGPLGPEGLDRRHPGSKAQHIGGYETACLVGSFCLNTMYHISCCIYHIFYTIYGIFHIRLLMFMWSFPEPVQVPWPPVGRRPCGLDAATLEARQGEDVAGCLGISYQEPKILSNLHDFRDQSPIDYGSIVCYIMSCRMFAINRRISSNSTPKNVKQ